MNIVKVAVLNNSGNVGKSTICQTLLKPRVADSELIRVESINNDGITSSEKMSAKDMVSIIEKIDLSDNVIIDIGSSNIEEFMLGLKRQAGSHEDIDLYIVPTTNDVKQQKDTITTINTLLDMGVESEQITIALNLVDETLSVEHQFDHLINSNIFKKLNIKSINDLVIIEKSELFTLLETIKQPFEKVISDESDYRSLIRSTQDKIERSTLSLKKSAVRLAKAHNAKLDIEFTKLPL